MTLLVNIKCVEVLGVEKSATQNDIKKAFLMNAKKYHPDVNKSKDAPKHFSELNEAYETLNDEHTRDMYDATGMSANEQANFKEQGG